MSEVSESDWDAGDEGSPNSLQMEKNLVESLAYLFKISLKIEDIGGERLKNCDFQASFLYLPTIVIKPNETAHMVFQLNKNDFSKFQNAAVFLSAILKSHTIGSADVNIATEFKALEREYENFPDCYAVQKGEKVIFSVEADRIGEAYFTLQLHCLGPSTDDVNYETAYVPCLFKFSFTIEAITGSKLKHCELFVNSSFFPTMALNSSEGKAVLFAMDKAGFAKVTNPKVCLIAVSKGKTISTANVVVTKEFRKLEEACEHYKGPLCTRKKENVRFIGNENDDAIRSLRLTLDMLCLGPSEIEDVPEAVLRESVDDHENADYDEYSANVCGHSLLIKMLRKKVEPEVCICDGPGGGHFRGNKGLPAIAEPKNSKLVYQVPTNDSAGRKCPAASCPKGSSPGKSFKQVLADAFSLPDTFGVKIGKKHKSTDSSGRLELDLIAPKKEVEDFKKPMSSKYTQTDTEVKTKGKKK